MSATDEFLAEWDPISDECASEIIGVPSSHFPRLERLHSFPGKFYVAHGVSGRGDVEVLCWALTHIELCACNSSALISMLLPKGVVTYEQLPERLGGLSVSEIRNAALYLGLPSAHCIEGVWGWLSVELEVWLTQSQHDVDEIRSAISHFAWGNKNAAANNNGTI